MGIITTRTFASLLYLGICFPVVLAATWTPLASIPATLREHTTVALSADKIVTIGGLVPGGATTKSVQVYTIPDNKWSKFADLPIAINHGNVAAVDGKIWLMGGLTSTSAAYTWEVTTTAAVYDPKTDKWTPFDGLPQAESRGASAVAVYNGTVWVAGGKKGTGQKSMVDVSAFDTATRKWISLPAAASKIPEPRDHVGGAVVGHKFYVVGGRDTQTDNVKNDVYILDLEDPAAGWKTGAKLPTARGGMAVAAVGTKIYAFGGEGNKAAGSQGIFKDAEVYDTETDSWAKLEPMSKPRHGTCAAAVEGKIYIPGGGTTSNIGTDVAYFDVYVP